MSIVTVDILRNWEDFQTRKPEVGGYLSNIADGSKKFKQFSLKINNSYIALSDPGTMKFVYVLGQSPRDWSTMIRVWPPA